MSIPSTFIHRMRAVPAVLVIVSLIVAQPVQAFAVEGKKGGFLARQIKPDEIAAADAVLASGGYRGLLGKSIDRGELEGVAIKLPYTQQHLEQMLTEVRATFVGGQGKEWTIRDPGKISIRLVVGDEYLAKVKPDNVLLINIGLLKPVKPRTDGSASASLAERQKTDDEIYWVLAHEFAHLGLSHFAHDAKAEKTRADIDKAVSGITAIGEVAQLKFVKNGNDIQIADSKDPATRKAADQAWAISHRVREGVSMLFNTLSIRQEDEADAAAVDIIRAMGLSDAAYPTALARIDSEDGSRAERAKAMKKAVKELLWPDRNFLGILSAAFEQFLQSGSLDVAALARNHAKVVMKNVGPTAFSMAKTQFSKTHRDAKGRSKGLKDYVDKAQLVPGWKSRPAANSHLATIWASAEFVDAMQMLDAIGAAKDALYAGADYDKALQAMQPALRSRHANSPAVANLMARIMAGKGDMAAAETWFDKAAGLVSASDAGKPQASAKTGEDVVAANAATLARGAAQAANRPTSPARPGQRPTRPAQPAKPATKAATAPAGVAVKPNVLTDPNYGQSPEGFAEHVEHLIKTSRPRRALDVIAEAKRRFGDDSAFLPQLFQIYLTAKDSEGAMKTLERCSNVGSKAVKDQCLNRFARSSTGEDYATLAAIDKDRVERSLSQLGDASRLRLLQTPEDVDEDDDDPRPSRQQRR